MLGLNLAFQMCLVEDRKNVFAGLEAWGIGEENSAAHIGTRDESGGFGARCVVVVVFAHYDFCVTVVEGNGVDLDQDFTWSWGGQGGAGESEVGDAGLCGEPLAGLSGEGHCCCCREGRLLRW